MMDAILIPGQLAHAVTLEGLMWTLIRITFILTLGSALLLALATRLSAATRHLVALATLGAALATPLADLVIPPGKAVVVPDLVVSTVSILSRIGPGGGDEIPAATTTGSPADSFGASTASITTAPAALQEPVGAVIIWLLVVVTTACLIRFTVGIASAWKLVRNATRITDDGLRAEIECIHQRLSIRRPITVLVSRNIAVPVVAGVLHPTVILPWSALAWSPGWRRVALIHEMAHVIRRDGLALVVSRIATALFWFHPLVWVLAGIARRECERACDDIVLSIGVRASDYADHLLAIARRAVPVRRAPLHTLAFARRTGLEGRLHALLRAGVPRRPASGWMIGAIGCLTLVVLLSVASLRVAAAPSPSDAEFSPKRQDVVESFNALKEARSTNAAEWKLIGKELLLWEEPALAAEAFERQHQLDHCPGALFNAARALAMSGRPQNALLMLERAERQGTPLWRQARRDSILAEIVSGITEHEGAGIDAGIDTPDGLSAPLPKRDW